MINLINCPTNISFLGKQDVYSVALYYPITITISIVFCQKTSLSFDSLTIIFDPNLFEILEFPNNANYDF